MKKKKFYSFQELIFLLKNFWKKKGYMIFQPLDIEIGAATLHPITYLKTLNLKKAAIAYTQLCRRPSDGRYGKNSHKMQQYYQFQVITKPSSNTIQDLYIKSLEILGLDLINQDIKFIEDNWENPTFGAWGIGWEIWLNGIEITQFTYFQKIGGVECIPNIIEISYGLERIAMHIQNVNTIYDIIWSNSKFGKITYGDIYYENEIEQCKHNFKYINTKLLFNNFEEYEKEIKRLLSLKEPLPLISYEYALKAAHIFNLLDAKKLISYNERQNYILRIQKMTKKIIKTYIHITQNNQNYHLNNE